MSLEEVKDLHNLCLWGSDLDIDGQIEFAMKREEKLLCKYLTKT